MKIELCEDNGFLNDGNPTLVVLVINGKHRIPYEATKTIQELYVDAHKYKDEPPDVIQPEKPSPSFISPTISESSSCSAPPAKLDIVEIDDIEREDIIRCHRLEKDLDGNVNEELTIGNEYRVINIIKQQNKLLCYEVLDDKADNKIRIPIRPDECELVKKHYKQIPRVQIFELKKKCSNCQEENALPLNKETNQYEISCVKCGSWMSEKRPVEKKEEANV